MAKKTLEGLIAFYLEEYKIKKIRKEQITLPSIKKFQNSLMIESNLLRFKQYINLKPYGSKSKESIINLTKQGIEFLLKFNVKAIIIACGTATSQALDVVKNLYSIPIIGIIESTVQYISQNSNLHKIGIVATAGTIRSNAWASSLLKLRPDLEIINKPCPLLAPMAEEGWTNNEIAKLAVKEYMQGLYDVDALILGCTHYPLFTNIFRENLKPNAEIINTGTMIANDLENKLGKNLLCDSSSNGNSEIYLTDTECNFLSVAEKLLNNRNISPKKGRP